MRGIPISGGGVVVVLALIWALAFFYFMGGPASNAEIEEASVEATLNEVEWNYDRFSECDTYTGPTHGGLEVNIHATVNDLQEPDGGSSSSSTYQLMVGIEDGKGSTSITVDEGEKEEFSSTVAFEDDKSMESGDKVTVNLILSHEGHNLDSVSRTATVEKKEVEFSCAD